jgi:hypothetical protein
MGILFECVSFPRCGSSLLYSLLSQRMELRITSPYAITQHDNPNVVKDHDFDLTKPILEGVRYVVLIRDFEECCLSYYRFKRLGFQHEETGRPYPIVDIQSYEYQAFRKETLEYYDAFRTKWIFGNKHKGTLLLNFADLLHDPEHETARVLQFAHRATRISEIFHQIISSPLHRIHDSL